MRQEFGIFGALARSRLTLRLTDNTPSMLKREADIIISFIGIIAVSPIIIAVMTAVYLADRSSPVYIAKRSGYQSRVFGMYKIRSMYVNSDKSNVWATSMDDPRITPIGKWIRKLKLDELPQLVNVLRGDMSFVGPRPLAPSETAVYNEIEKQILSVKPGITDIASFVLFDEEQLLSGAEDSSIYYNQMIRPWKSRLALYYVKNRTWIMDVMLVLLTVVSIFSRSMSLRLFRKYLDTLDMEPDLKSIAKRECSIYMIDPPGKIVYHV